MRSGYQEDRRPPPDVCRKHGDNAHWRACARVRRGRGSPESRFQEALLHLLDECQAALALAPPARVPLDLLERGNRGRRILRKAFEMVRALDGHSVERIEAHAHPALLDELVAADALRARCPVKKKCRAALSRMRI